MATWLLAATWLRGYWLRGHVATGFVTTRPSLLLGLRDYSGFVTTGYVATGYVSTGYLAASQIVRRVGVSERRNHGDMVT